MTSCKELYNSGSAEFRRLGPVCEAYGTFEKGFELVGNREIAMSEAKGFLEFFQRKLFTDK